LLRRSPEKLMISFSWALTNVVPIHATPSTQMLALIPDLNVDAERISFVGALHRRTIAAAVDNMNAMIAWSRVITGSVMRPTFLLMAVAYAITPSRPMTKISTDSLALGAISRSWRPLTVTAPAARRFWYSGWVLRSVFPRILSTAIMIAAVAMQARKVEGMATARSAR